jgi:hypothetical protein
MGLLDELKAELLAAKTTIEPQIEGLHDFARLNLKPETLEAVKSATVDFERRLKLINEGLVALDNLASDQYPSVPERNVEAAVFNDLRENVSTIEAAFKKFALPDPAVTVQIIPGIPTEHL